MKYIVTFDFGTTAAKCAVIDEDEKVVFFKEKDITTYNSGEHIEQNPNEWYEAFINLSKEFFSKGYNSNDILGIVCSGQMQDVILVDNMGNSLGNAILYNDQRGKSEVQYINKELLEFIKEKTANDINGTIPLAKLMWLKKYRKDLYSRIFKILISSKDFIITKLTGNFVSDVTSLSTSGMMDIKNKEYISEIENLGIKKSLLPQICYADEIAGEITPEASEVSGYKAGTNVYVGSGDAGATTLASGISKEGDININLGTSGWVASISKTVSPKAFNLSAINRDLFINVTPVLNAGNVHKWIANIIDGEGNKYDYLSRLMIKSDPNPSNLFFLPYIVGERFPVADSNVRGCYIGINSNTTKADIIRATLEGVAFSIKQCLVALGMKPNKISLIGGGAQDPVWNQIFADILGTDVVVYENSKFLPSMALACVVMLRKGKISSYDDFVTKLIHNTKSSIFQVNQANNYIYTKAFEKFIKIYPSVKNLFE